jgi:hypothetical protein
LPLLMEINSHFFIVKETLKVFQEARIRRGVVPKRKTMVSMEEFELFIIPVIHMVEVGFRDIREGEVLDIVGVRVKSSLPYVALERSL